MDFKIQNNEIYYIDEKGEKAAEVTFPNIDADTVEINHTFVSPVSYTHLTLPTN